MGSDRRWLRLGISVPREGCSAGPGLTIQEAVRLCSLQWSTALTALEYSVYSNIELNSAGFSVRNYIKLYPIFWIKVKEMAQMAHWDGTLRKLMAQAILSRLKSEVFRVSSLLESALTRCRCVPRLIWVGSDSSRVSSIGKSSVVKGSYCFGNLIQLWYSAHFWNKSDFNCIKLYQFFWIKVKEKSQNITTSYHKISQVVSSCCWAL